jgi:hypothetical protein
MGVDIGAYKGRIDIFAVQIKSRNGTKVPRRRRETIADLWG